MAWMARVMYGENGCGRYTKKPRGLAGLAGFVGLFDGGAVNEPLALSW